MEAVEVAAKIVSMVVPFLPYVFRPRGKSLDGPGPTASSDKSLRAQEILDRVLRGFPTGAPERRRFEEALESGEDTSIREALISLVRAGMGNEELAPWLSELAGRASSQCAGDNSIQVMNARDVNIKR